MADSKRWPDSCSQLGEIPQAGRIVDFEGRRFTVLEMERNRIARVRAEKIVPAQAPAAG